MVIKRNSSKKNRLIATTTNEAKLIVSIRAVATYLPSTVKTTGIPHKKLKGNRHDELNY